ncbi:MAG: hypothetical protein LC115_03565, partial [Bacteroidia bacterium]|nr:hypothetical protein [Bacteroidia bacterium]
MKNSSILRLIVVLTAVLWVNIAAKSQTIITVAGVGTTGFSGDGGPATSAQVNSPTSVCRDIYGNLYIADRYNHRIRKVDANTGVITTIAGTGTAGFSGDGGLATAAQFNQPIGIIVAVDGTIYISDNNNNRIRKIDTAGIITTIAGTGTAGFSGDNGPATAANLKLPWGVALDSNNKLYIADRDNDRVRKIDINTGIITTVAGTGTTGYSGDAGLATSANFNKPISVAVDTAFNLYIADENNHRVRKVTYATGIVNKIAGTGAGGYNGDGGAAVGAQLNYPSGVAVDLAGNVYISDRMNHRLRKINTSGTISTFAGTGSGGFSGDGGNATSAKILYPRELFSDGSGNIYFTDTNNNRIRKITYCNLPTIPAIAASQNNFCVGDSTTLTITSGSLNAALNWQWYDISCGVHNIGSGTSITVSPLTTTTYYVRGEGGCATPYGCGSITINVNQVPQQPSSISGDTIICSGLSKTYSINPVSGATNYTWTLPNGWTGNSTSTSINATAGNAGGTISVIANSNCGSSTAQTLAINVAQAPAQPGSISGSTTICASSSNTYSINPVSGATNYTWTLPNGWTGNSTSTSINATAGNAGGTISVIANSNCGSSTAQTLAITATAVDISVSVNAASLTSNASSASYQWVNCPSMTFINGETNQVYSPISSGNYAVIVTQG